MRSQNAGFLLRRVGFTRRSCLNQPVPYPFSLLSALITSRTRIRLLLKFFSNSKTSAYLRSLADEFGESTNAVRIELKRLQDAGLLVSRANGNKRYYRANRDHVLYPDLKSLTRKSLGINQIEGMIDRLGNVEQALITGDYALGRDSGIIDLVIVGKVDEHYLHHLVGKAEALIDRKIRTLLFTTEEFIQYEQRFTNENALVIWQS